jgi:UDP-N-acetylglucosamine--N-acetylmuramyl-(pentapeptide) pyrophosphoryl-undecaprenol N-acetylglucosamine transferase
MLRVVLTGGGTGGHLYPGLAIADELAKRVPCTFLFIGTRRGIESSVVPAKGMAFKTVWIDGLRRGRFLANLFLPLKMAVSFFQALAILIRFRPNLAVGTGGYVSWPVIAAASLTGCHTVIQEQNQKPGLVTRLLARRADAVHLSFESSAAYFRRNRRLHVSGNPTRADLERSRNESAYGQFGLDPGRTTLFVFGGSQGAKGLNAAFIQIAGSLVAETGIQILWAAGPRWSADIQNQTQSFGGDRIRVFPYINEMGLAYAVTDLVVCRAGASTVAEVARLGLPVIFVPFPGAAEGHQEANAKTMAEAGAAVVVPEGPDLALRLGSEVLRLVRDPEKREILSGRIRSFARPDAAERIVTQILETL